MQGRLRQKNIQVTARTSCAHCGREMTIDLDSNLAGAAREPGCEPVVFIPEVNFSTMEDDNITREF